MLGLGDIGPIKRKKDILNMTYVNETILSKEQLNDNLCQFIQRDRVMALYTMNQMLKFLYPCKVWRIRDLKEQKENLETGQKDIIKRQHLKFTDN